MAIGNCPHGKFDLVEGCPQCIAERQAADRMAKAKDGLLNPEGLTLSDPEAWRTGDEEVRSELHKGPGAEIETVSSGVEIPEGSALVVVDASKAPNFSRHLEAAKRVLEIASTRKILTETDAKGANDDIVVMSELEKAIDTERRSFTDPLNGYVKSINEAYKLITDPLTEADQITRTLLTTWKVEQQRKAAEAEKLNLDAMELARRQAEANQGEFTVDTKPVPVPFAPKLTRTAQGKSGLIDYWKYEVTDIDLLPREYMIPDDDMLTSIAKKQHDKKEVAGVRFYNEPGLRASREVK